MEKLKRKTFIVIFSILTIFLISILCIFNYQDYKHEKTEIKNNLNKINRRNENIEFNIEKNKEEDQNKNKQTEENTIEKELNQNIQINEPIDKNQNIQTEEQPIEEQTKTEPIFMDAIVYTIIYNDQKEVIEILNHTQGTTSDNKIKEKAQEILNQENAKTIYVGNLYIEEYSYSFKGHNTLTIIDNQMSKNRLQSLLRMSIIIFIILEMIIIIISTKITSWIIKPVIETFNKQKQFITDASHELKTPVAVIMANAEALENEPEETKWLENIKSESERMNELISNLLDLAKLENGAQKEEYNTEDLSKIIEREVLTFESLIYENKIKLTYNIEENIKLNCNKMQMKQLIAILLDNAIKHSEKEGEIKVTLQKEKNEINLKVTNKGKEIPKEMQEKIFERFYRADESRNRNTNRYGLGLAIAKSIVTNHNGKIEVQSINGYTTFTIKLKKTQNTQKTK